METKRRALRRHHNERIFKKRLCEERRKSFAGESDSPIVKWARVRVKTAKVCSCFLCGNPRRKKLPLGWRRTLAEQRADDRMRDMLTELC